MNELERRTLLGAAVGGGIAALSKAGPLNPPSGSVVSSGRTLDEVYNRIGAGDSRIPVGGSVISILDRGSYILTQPIVTTASPISIAAVGVTLDLNGQTIRSTTGTGTGITIGAGSEGVVIRNGIIDSFNLGILLSGIQSGIVLEDLVIVASRTSGIVSSHASATAFRIRRCTIIGTGAGSTSAASNNTGIQLQGGGHVIEDCHIAGVTSLGGSNTRRGIWLSTTIAGGGVGHCVSRCTVTSAPSVTGTAFQFEGRGVYRDNTASGFGTFFTAPGMIDGGGNAGSA